MKTELIDVVIETSQRKLAEIAGKHHQEINHKVLLDFLKSEIKSGYNLLVAEMREADAAFHGNASMLSAVFQVGCLKFAVDAWTKYQQSQPVKEAA